MRLARPDSTPRDAYLAVERFLRGSEQPILMEPGEDPIPIREDNFAIECKAQSATIEAWSETATLVRRLRGVHAERKGKLELEVERFGGRAGILLLADLAHPANRDAGRRGARLKYREVFRKALRRQFPEWKLAELSTEADLHHSLSPAYPRALLRRGTAGLAAIGASADCLDVDGVLSYGLIWLDYLRQREQRLVVEGLVVFAPAGREHTTCHRVRCLNPRAARFLVFAHDPSGLEQQVDPADYTNFDSRVEPFHRGSLESLELAAAVDRVAGLEGVEKRYRPDGSVSLAVRGLEFARAAGGKLLFGIDQKHAARFGQISEVEDLARGLARIRHPSGDRANPLFTRHAEAWLESQVRGQIERIDASLLPEPVYGQVPQFAAGERGIVDLLACERGGRLTVIELKASQDIHLPLQALDYWMRVKWHLERGEFAGRGYFPGVELRSEAPRLILVAPSLEFHPTNEILLRYFSRQVEAERVGVGLQWRQELQVMFRTPAFPWPLPSYAK